MALLHCFHATGRVLMGYPTSFVDKCCWCGTTRNRTKVELTDPDHGPHVHATRWQESKPKEDEECPSRSPTSGHTSSVPPADPR